MGGEAPRIEAGGESMTSSIDRDRAGWQRKKDKKKPGALPLRQFPSWEKKNNQKKKKTDTSPKKPPAKKKVLGEEVLFSKAIVWLG